MAMLGARVAPPRDRTLTPTAAGADERNHSRLQGFSDAVFALAATLLVVTLEVPDSYEALIEVIGGFPAFALAFAAIVSMWNNHRNFFAHFPLADAWTVAVNSVLLFVLLLYVYPLKLFAEVVAGYVLGTPSAAWEAMGPAEVRGLFVVFGLGVLATMVSFLALHVRAWRQRDSLDLDASALAVLRRDLLSYAAISGIALVSVVIAALGVGIAVGLPGLVYLLAPVVSIALQHRG